jgi:Uma2 family endonuclease
VVTHASPFVPVRADAPAEDRRFVLYGVDWDTYEQLRERLGNGLRLTYLEGTLELMSPSFAHEDLKTVIARLLEAWAEENDVDLNGYGNVTLKNRPRERALEPDECYCVGRIHETPDIAIEVVVSTGYLDMLEVYRGLGVREVWAFKDCSISVLELLGEAYSPRVGSGVLPALDLEQLGKYVKAGQSQTAQVRAYRAELRRAIAST